MYKTSIGEFNFEIIPGSNTQVNGIARNVNFSKETEKSFLVQIDGKTKVADLVKLDKDLKQVVLRIEGKKYSIQIKEPIDILLDRLGIKIGNSKKVNDLKAPMPGMIIKVLAKVGEHYKAGEPLLVLEAMKMENVFKAAADITIKDILIDEKNTVEKGQVLMVFE